MKNRVIVISGATSGIGLACLHTLAAAGATVVGFGRSESKVQNLRIGLQEEYGAERVSLSALDILDTAALENFVARVVQDHQRIDGVINAAGVLEMSKTHKVSAESFTAQSGVLFQGTFQLTQFVLAPMLKQKSGLVINLGSVSGNRAAPGMAVYGAAKAAVQHLTTSLAAEYAAKGIRFLCVNPGPVETALMEPLMFEMLAKSVPLQRVGQPEEVAGLIRFLFSDDARFMTGSTITMDGGAVL